MVYCVGIFVGACVTPPDPDISGNLHEERNCHKIGL